MEALGEIVADADRLLELVGQAQEILPEDSAEREGIVAAAELLERLLLQHVKRGADGDGNGDGNGDDEGVSLRDEVARDRMMSVHDPELRHGRKSRRRRLDGHKAAIVALVLIEPDFAAHVIHHAGDGVRTVADGSFLFHQRR